MKYIKSFALHENETKEPLSSVTYDRTSILPVEFEQAKFDETLKELENSNDDESAIKAAVEIVPMLRDLSLKSQETRNVKSAEFTKLEQECDKFFDAMTAHFPDEKKFSEIAAKVKSTVIRNQKTSETTS